jgi:hypothetical protein
MRLEKQGQDDWMEKMIKRKEGVLEMGVRSP